MLLSQIFSILGVIGFIGFIAGLLNQEAGYFIGKCVKFMLKLFSKIIVKTISYMYAYQNKEKKMQENVITSDKAYASYAGKSGRDLVVSNQSDLHRPLGLAHDEQHKMFVKIKAQSKQ